MIVPSSKVPCGPLMRRQFQFAEGYMPLNHGSFGAFPHVVADRLQNFRQRTEQRPDGFIRFEFPALQDQSRDAISHFLNASSSEVVFVPNATTATNTVLRSLVWQPGDVILTFERSMSLRSFLLET